MLEKLKIFLTENARGLLVTSILLSLIAIVIQFGTGSSYLADFLWGTAGLFIVGAYVGLGKSRSHTVGIAFVYSASFFPGLSSMLILSLGFLFLFDILKIEG